MLTTLIGYSLFSLSCPGGPIFIQCLYFHFIRVSVVTRGDKSMCSCTILNLKTALCILMTTLLKKWTMTVFTHGKSMWYMEKYPFPHIDRSGSIDPHPCFRPKCYPISSIFTGLYSTFFNLLKNCLGNYIPRKQTLYLYTS